MIAGPDWFALRLNFRIDAAAGWLRHYKRGRTLSNAASFAIRPVPRERNLKIG